MNMKRVAVLLVRGGSKRLPGKALLPWQGTTLLGHAIKQTLCCPAVDCVVVGSDSPELLHYAERCTLDPDAIALGARDGRVIALRRPEVPDTQTSFQGLKELMRPDNLPGVGIENALLLVQCTSPFINPLDLLTLCKEPDPMPGELVALSADGVRPSGMGYLMHRVGPEPTKKRFVLQRASAIDVDTLADYKRALQAMPIQPVYGR